MHTMRGLEGMRYSVLLVDDERIIREGIASIIDWENLGFSLCGTAQNGIEAINMIDSNPPDVVITDIKMPVLNGLELIERAKKQYPDIIFIVLSGHGEFEFASTAMKHGVKHYLMKPCNEGKIIEVLEDVKSELSQREDREEFILRNRQNMDKVLPLVREQFIRDFIMNRAYTREEFEYYRKLLGIESSCVRLMLFQPEGDYGFEEILALVNIIETVIGKEILCFNTVVKNQVLLLIDAIPINEMTGFIGRIKETFNYYNAKEINISYSDSGCFEEAPLMYKDAQECLTYSFYLGGGSVISRGDLISEGGKTDNDSMFFDYEKISASIKSGNVENVEREIDAFFKELKSAKLGINIAKTYCMELFLVLARQHRAEDSDKYMKRVLEMQMMDSLDKIQQFLKEAGIKLAKLNYEGIVKRHGKLVRTIIKHVNENIDNENLSLKWLASEVLFMNVGYLSKLFNKEMGEKFPHYLMKLRMEKARELIRTSEEDRVSEVARKVGFGDNAQYFSHLFKKCTGYTPSEYKRGKTPFKAES